MFTGRRIYRHWENGWARPASEVSSANHTVAASTQPPGMLGCVGEGPGQSSDVLGALGSILTPQPPPPPLILQRNFQWLRAPVTQAGDGGDIPNPEAGWPSRMGLHYLPINSDWQAGAAGGSTHGGHHGYAGWGRSRLPFLRRQRWRGAGANQNSHQTPSPNQTL